MICSVLIPSRGRPERLLKTIRSLIASCSGKPSFDIRIRLDSDDKITGPFMGEINAFPNTVVFIGDRMMGYPSLNLFYSQLADSSPAMWVWIMNDDCEIRGEDWDVKLETIPTMGFIVQPEYLVNGFSLYPDCEGGAFPIVPNGIWRQLGELTIQDPADSQLDNLLRVKNGWQTKFLDGITVFHDRDNDGELAKHRKL